MNDLFRFIGEDGSMGLRNGRIYLIRIGVEWQDKFFKTMPTTHFVGRNSNAMCPYESWDSFLENWERV